MESKIEIPLSKGKTVRYLIVTMIFIAISALLVINPDYFVSAIVKSPTLIRTAGIFGVVFFGFCLYYISRKLLDKQPGLILDENGITDNTSASSLGLIEWNDIVGIEKRQVMSTKFLILNVRNSEKYRNKARGYIIKKAVDLNMKNYGSPISVISNSLKIDFDSLEKLIKSEFAKRSRNK